MTDYDWFTPDPHVSDNRNYLAQTVAGERAWCLLLPVRRVTDGRRWPSITGAAPE